ncbi:MAG: YqiA/YcfP family alpha/beta fold hydrolase [Burkholderiaceae bacterium]
MNMSAGDTTITHLLYLHGFRSSPQSTKARLLAERVALDHPGVTWWCPQLPPSPAQAIALIRDGVSGWPSDRSAVVGSSLGGFYARYVGLALGWRRALLNPAVHPARDLARYIGEQTAWHDPQASFFFEPTYVDELRAQEAAIAAMARTGPVGPGLQYALIARGDEVLDWREMQAFSAGGTVRILPGSDHAISDFTDHIDELLVFLRLSV